jgi:hypothetical protein
MLFYSTRALLVLVCFAWCGLLHAEQPSKVRITTWNLEWFPNGSAREATSEKQAQRIQAAADVLKKLNPDILLLQEVRITMHVPVSAKPSRREFIMWPFALLSRNHSRAALGNSKLRSYPNIKRKRHGQSLGNP